MFSHQESLQANEAIQSVFPLDWRGIGAGDQDAKATSAQERARIAEQTENMMPSGRVEQDGSLVFDLEGAEAEVFSPAVAARESSTGLSDADTARLREAAEAIREATGQDNWIARWTDEETIFALLKDADKSERAELDRLYKEKYGISLEDELKRSMSGADEDRALNLLNRMDGSATDLHAATIHTDLIDIDQKFFGRKRSELETEIRNIFAGKNSGEIAELEREYRAKFGVGLREQIASSEKMSQATKDAINVYFKGVDGRTDADIMNLAENALQTRNVARFQEAMRDAGAEARQKFLDEGGAEKILEAFGVPNSDDVNGGYVQTKDSLNALDYAEHGKLSAAQQVRDNTGVFHFTSNTNGIEAAIGAMTADERQKYELGKAVNDGRAVDTAVSESDRGNALAFYKELNGAMHEVGNQSELLAWEDQISNQGGTIISALARHRGTIYDDSVDEMCSTAEGMSQADWERLKDPARGGEFRQQIEAMLKTYASASETARVMEIVDKKAALTSYAEASTARRSLTNALEDRTHWFGPNDSEGILDDISKMSVQEQERYRTDMQYRKVVNEAVEDKLSGTAEDAAHGLLQRVLRGEKPEQDLVTMLQLRASDSMTPWARVQAVRRDLQKYFDEDEALFDRIKNPKTAEDVRLSQQILELASKSLPKEYLDNYIKPMLETGSIDLEKVIALDIMNGEREKVLADLAEAPADRREDLSAKLNETEIARFFNPDELAVMQNVLKNGRMDTADALRAQIVGWGQKDEIMDCLRQLNPNQLEEAKAGYARKYSEDLLADLLDKLGGERKLEAERIMLSNNQTEEEKLNDLIQQGSQSHSGFGAGFTDNVCNVGTGYQIDAAINDTVQRMAEAAKSGRRLTGEELQDIQSRFLDVNRNYRDSKAAAADNVVNGAMAVAAVGGAAVTGGSSLALLGAMVPTGAALKFGTKALILGSDYDYTTGQVVTDLATGGINAGANVVGGAQMGALFGVEKATMGAVTEIGLSAAAGGFGGGLSRFAESVAQQQNGQEILNATLSGTATGAVFASALSAATVGLRNAWGAISPGAA
ncbi:MAG: hypothetical protein IT342_14700, partial [Candidatus Melainabacteria bacterium]|nr:hypothetical protein [Candidatus Melainabacteria bacterium]